MRADIQLKRAKLFERLGWLERELAGLRTRLGLEKGHALPNVPSLDPATLQLIVQYASDCISIHGPDGRYLFVSGAFTTYFGWKPEDLIDHSAYEFHHPDDVARVAADHARYGETERKHTVAYRLRCTDNSYRWVETRSEAYVTDQGVQRIICFTRDLSDLFRSIEDLHNRVAELDTLSCRDDLTGLANRRQLQKRLDDLLKEGRRHRRFCVALIDVDHFKRINDTLGHVKGDAALVSVAHALAVSCRDVDMVARYGGDEFCSLYVDATLDAAKELARRQCLTVARLNFADAPLTVSVGVTEYEDGDNMEALFKRADAALYAAKTQGRNQVHATA